MVVRTGLRLVGLGVAIGILGSLALGRVIEAELWGVSAYDPLTLVRVAAIGGDRSGGVPAAGAPGLARGPAGGAALRMMTPDLLLT